MAETAENCGNSELPMIFVRFDTFCKCQECRDSNQLLFGLQTQIASPVDRHQSSSWHRAAASAHPAAVDSPLLGGGGGKTGNCKNTTDFQFKIFWITNLCHPSRDDATQGATLLCAARAHMAESAAERPSTAFVGESPSAVASFGWWWQAAAVAAAARDAAANACDISFCKCAAAHIDEFKCSARVWLCSSCCCI